MSNSWDVDVLVCLYCETPNGEIHHPLCGVRAGKPRLYKPKGSAAAAPLADAGPDAKCSFCHTPRAAVKRLFASPTASICEGCVELCNDVIEAEESKAA